MSKISKNIRHLRQLKKWSQEQLAEELDISRARIGSYEEERCDPPIEILVRLSNLFHIAVDALVKCDLRKFDSNTFMEVAENRILFPVVVDRQNNDQVEVVTVKASAGYLNGYADPEYIEMLPLMNLPFRIVGKHRAFPIKGDSMPPLREGSYVIGKFLESVSEVRNGSTYILITRNEGIVYKRVYLNKGNLELHSDNKVYHPYTIHPSEVIELWEFVCNLNMSDKKTEELNLDSIMDM
ncbi:MAG: helix-turn-helix domain-containing protein, partial [Flavobacteriales bacterium]|nr:helix-turn-helix domain-containing protein [Flavobacteriales bacterium]